MNICLEYFWIFQKHLDTVNYKILYEKLEFYGIRGIAPEWIKNYLTGRTHYVYFGDEADLLPVTCGVSQVSILGPLLFLTYVYKMIFVMYRMFCTHYSLLMSLPMKKIWMTLLPK